MKKLVRSKKASTEGSNLGSDTMYFAVAALLITGAFIVAVYLFSKNRVINLEIPANLFLSIYYYRFVNSPYCFAYQDIQTERTYPGVIDFEKFNETRLAECYRSNQRSKYEFVLTLKEDFSGIKKTIKTPNADMNVWESRIKRVFIQKGDKKLRGTLEIGIEK